MYLQTMYRIGSLRRIPKIGYKLYLAVQWICGKITGHQWSKTDWGYGGGGVDVWCRWCNHFETIPIEDAVKIFPHMRKTIWENIGTDITQSNTSFGMEANHERL